MSGIPTDQVLAIMALKTWAADTAALAHARTAQHKHRGWQQRRERQFNSRLVRVIDFENAIARLTIDEQQALILAYRDGHSTTAIAQTLHCSTRRVVYLLPAARQHLADVLGRLDLL